MQPTGDEITKLEYSELGQNMRHASNLQFAQITVMLAINAGIASVLFNPQSTISGSGQLVMSSFALVEVALFFVMSERIISHWRAYHARAKVIETTTGCQQYTTSPPKVIISQTNAVRIFFVSLVVFWALYPFIRTGPLINSPSLQLVDQSPSIVPTTAPTTQALRTQTK